MFGIEKIKSDISRLQDAVIEADNVARCAIKDGYVISVSANRALPCQAL
jgi:hypothetical protein